MTRSALASRLALAAAIPFGAALVSIGVAAAVDGGGIDTLVPAGVTVSTSSTASTSPSTVATTPSTVGAGAIDISGNCDEAEHAADPECAGVVLPTTPSTQGTVGGGVDISGPCDEAEHIGDPRCTGAGIVEDNSGPGSGDDRDDDSSGPGSGDDDLDDDGSGPGSGDDDEDDDNSGPGSGDDAGDDD